MFTNKKREGIDTFVSSVSLYVAKKPKASIKDHETNYPQYLSVLLYTGLSRDNQIFEIVGSLNCPRYGASFFGVQELCFKSDTHSTERCVHVGSAKTLLPRNIGSGNFMSLFQGAEFCLLVWSHV